MTAKSRMVRYSNDRATAERLLAQCLMPMTVDLPTDVFTRDDFERAWQRDVESPRDALVRPETALLLRRNSPHDFQDRQIYVWVDEEPLGKIRYGQSITQALEPGA